MIQPSYLSPGRPPRATESASNKRPCLAQVWECGDLVGDEVMGSVTRARSPIRLTATEFNILAVLVRQSDRVVYKEQLFGQVWKYGADRHLLEVHMISLRHKLKVHGSRMIHTVQGLRLRPATLRTTVVRVD